MRGQTRHLLALASGRSLFYPRPLSKPWTWDHPTFLLFRLFIPFPLDCRQKQVFCPPWLQLLWWRLLKGLLLLLLYLYLHLLQHLQSLIILNITRPPPPPHQVHLQINKVIFFQPTPTTLIFPTIVFIPTFLPTIYK